MAATKTYSLYTIEDDGSRFFAGTFRSAAPSAREIARYLHRTMPNLDLSRCEVAQRTRHMEYAPFKLDVPPFD